MIRTSLIWVPKSHLMRAVAGDFDRHFHKGIICEDDLFLDYYPIPSIHGKVKFARYSEDYTINQVFDHEATAIYLLSVVLPAARAINKNIRASY